LGLMSVEGEDVETEALKSIKENQHCIGGDMVHLYVYKKKNLIAYTMFNVEKKVTHLFQREIYCSLYTYGVYYPVTLGFIAHKSIYVFKSVYVQ